MSVGGRLRPEGSLQLADYPVDLAWSADGRALLVGLADGTLHWVAVQGAPIARLPPAHAAGVLALACARAGRLAASSGQDGVVRLWDIASGEHRELLRLPHWSEQLAFSDDGRWLAVSTGRTLRLFDSQGQAVYEYVAAGGTITALAWRPKVRELAAAGNGGVHFHQPPPQGQRRDYPLRGACLTAAFSPDGRRLASGLQEGSVRLWNVLTGSHSQMSGYGSRVFATTWSGNGRYLATAAGGTLAVWDCGGRGPEGTEPIQLEGHAERLTALAFRPSGTWLASCATDHRLLWWRVGAAPTPQDAHLLPQEGTVLRFSPDGRRLAVADASGRIAWYVCDP